MSFRHALPLLIFLVAVTAVGCITPKVTSSLRVNIVHQLDNDTTTNMEYSVILQGE